MNICHISLRLYYYNRCNMHFTIHDVINLRASCVRFSYYSRGNTVTVARSLRKYFFLLYFVRVCVSQIHLYKCRCIEILCVTITDSYSGITCLLLHLLKDRVVVFIINIINHHQSLMIVENMWKYLFLFSLILLDNKNETRPSC